MKTSSTLRWLRNETYQELQESFARVFPDDPAKMLSKAEAISTWKRLEGQAGIRINAARDSQANSVIVFVYPGSDAAAFETSDPATEPCSALEINGVIAPAEDDPDHDLQFARNLMRAFNADLARCPDESASEVWRALRASQFPRAVAGTLGFKASQATSWLHAMESSMSLTYESKPVRHVILIAKSAAALRTQIRDYIAPLKKPLTIESALLREKWVRAMIDGERVVLLGNKRGQVTDLISLAAIPVDVSGSEEPTYAPHYELTRLQHIMKSEDIALVASPSGDIHVQLGRGVVFHKSQGAWNYNNYASIAQRICRVIAPDLTVHLLRTALDLAYERKGALFCVLAPHTEPDALVRDRSLPDRANQLLRQSLVGMNICKWSERQVIAAAAATDGATVLNSRGRVVDIACLIDTPNKMSRRAGNANRNHAGSRSTAAWHASFGGLAIKVSEDGPIAVYHKGKVIASVN